MTIHRALRTSRLPALLTAALIGTAAAPAYALTGSADASDVTVHINLLGVATLDVDPQVPTGINAAVDATVQQDTLPAFDTGGTLLHLTTSTLLSKSEFNPGGTLAYSQSDVNVENLNLSAVGILGASLLSISADAIHAGTQVIGWCPIAGKRSMVDASDVLFFNEFDNGNLFPGGTSGSPGDVTLTGIEISILGIAVPNLPLDPPPNTTISLAPLGIVGATLVLNEQVVGGDGVTTSSVSSNAVHLTLNVAGLITADVTIAHSDSKLDCTQ